MQETDSTPNLGTDTHVELGLWYRDTLTDFSGIATAHCAYLHSPDQVYLENSDHARWVDETRLAGGAETRWELTQASAAS